MKIQLVSYIVNLSPDDKISVTADIINSSKSDLIFFPGDTLNDINDAYKLQSLVRNKKTIALLEISQLSIEDFDTRIINCPFLIQDGKLVNMHTFQYFATSDAIENNVFLAEAFINELETRRQFKVKGYNCLILQCGENNILKNIQSEDNNVVIRLSEKSLARRFKQVLNGSDIILNAIHQPQYGNQNKLHKRREYFSQNKRLYFSTNNCYKLSSSAKSIQYAYRNGLGIDCPEPTIDSKERYMYRLFEI